MTTYTKTGYKLIADASGELASVQSATLRIVTEDALTQMNYSYFSSDPGEEPTVDVEFSDTGNIWNIALDDVQQSDPTPGVLEIDTGSARGRYLIFVDLQTSDVSFFALDGVDVLNAPFSTIFAGFNGTWSVNRITTGAFQPNTDIPITSFPWDTTSENDHIIAFDGQQIDAGIGNDSIVGSTGDDDLAGGAGNDTLVASAGFDTISGGAGIDTFVSQVPLDGINVYATQGGIELDSGFNLDQVTDDIEEFVFAGTSYTRAQVLAQIDTTTTVSLTDDNDIHTGTADNESITARAGNDFITPGMGDDTIDGGAGTDTASFINYAAAVIVNLSEGTADSGFDANVLIDIENITGSVFGDYIVTDEGVNRIRASGGYDWMVASEGADYFDGGTGRDMISYVYADTGVTINLGEGRGLAGQAAGDRYVNIERITGSVHADLFYGGEGEEDFRGLGGYDWFVGSTGGRERFDGGTGRDTVAYSLSETGVTASLALGYGSGGDALRDLYTSIENLTGSSHDDVLTGDGGRNILRGLFGEDRLSGGGGTDRLMGGASDDYLDGGRGWDVAMFEGERDEYTITIGTAGVIVTHDGRDGTDTIFNVEALQFADDMVFL